MPIDLDSLIKTTLTEIKNPSTAKQCLVVVGGVIGVVASYVYYQPTQQLIQEKNYPKGYGYVLLAGSLGVNPLLNTFFNASAVNTVFNLRDPVTDKLKISRGVLAVTGVLSFASAFIPAFLAPPDETVFSYVNFFAQLVCHTAQSYVGIMASVRFFRGLSCGTATSSPLKQLKSHLSQAIEALLSDCSLDKDFNMSQFKESGEISPQKLSAAILSKCHNQSIQTDSKARCTPGFTIYLLVQGVGFIAQIISLIGYENSGVNGFNNMIMIMGLAWALATFAIMPIVSVSFQISYDSIKTLASINPRKPFENLPYEIRKTPWFSGFCLLITTTMAIFSFPTTQDLLQDAIYNTGPEDNPSQFTWMDSGNDMINCIFMILGCFGTVFFNAFPLIDVQAYLSRKFYLLTAKPQEAKSFREKSQLIEVLATTKTHVEEIPEDNAIPVESEDIETESPTPVTAHRVTHSNQFMAWLRSSSPCCADTSRTGYVSIN